MNFVESHYRTINDKAHRAIAGLSMGGFHSLYISANYPDKFDYVGLFSAAINRESKGENTYIYKNLEEGKAYTGKSLPVVVKNYKESRPKSVLLYVGQYFGIFSFLDFLQIYAECTLEVRRLLDPILAKV